MSTGKRIANRRPVFRSPPKASAAKPTTVGPEAQPTSPASAISAYIAVPAEGRLSAAMLKVPGQKMPTEKPHTAHPSSPKAGLEDREAVR